MKKYTPLLVFLPLAFIILPYFGKGYYFLLDNPFTSHIDFSMKAFSDLSFFFFLAFFKGLSLLIPTWLIQRFFYGSIIFLLGFGGYKLLEGKTKIGAYFAGILLMFNPYVYARMLDGQVGVVAGIAMCIFFYCFLMRFLETRKYRDLLLSSLFGAFSIMWTSHSLFFIFGSLFVFFLFDTLKKRNFGANFKAILVSTVIVLILNANWIIGNIVGNGSLTQTLGQISQEHFQAFATDSGKTNLYFNTLTLHGFWGERQAKYVPTYFDNAHWQILFLVLFALVLVGVYARIRDPDNEAKSHDYALLSLGVAAYILSLGISGDNIFAPITRFLYDYMPFYAGLREPQKWSGILLIVYAYFGGYGVSHIYLHPFVQKGYPKVIALGLLLLPILSTPTMLFGFNGQLFVSDYPKEWYSLKEEFGKISESTESEGKTGCTYMTEQKTEKCYDVISLPWHQYIGLSFTRKTIANPVEGFFDTIRILQGDNMEIGNIYTQSVRPESKIIERYIGPGGVFIDGMSNDEANSFLSDLRGLGIRHILVLKESDYRKYDIWMTEMEKTGKITMKKDNDRLKLFLIGDMPKR